MSALLMGLCILNGRFVIAVWSVARVSLLNFERRCTVHKFKLGKSLSYCLVVILLALSRRERRARHILIASHHRSELLLRQQNSAIPIFSEAITVELVTTAIGMLVGLWLGVGMILGLLMVLLS